MVSKKIYGIIGLSVLAGITAIATVSGSIAWLNRTASIDNKSNISGSAQIAYFGGGDGTSGDPYIINKPVHLYNLAWLQYIGYFKDNQTDTGGGSIDPSKQPYFLMNADIDMSSFNSALPPIGTSKYPFVGNFNGGGHTISSILISNDFKDTNKHPSVVDSLSDVECVGLFGVVGKMPDQTFTYNSKINQISNLGILDATIKSSTSKTLIGIAGGYVNAELDNVGVNDSNLYTKESASALDPEITTNISDYSLVGFATNEHKGKMRLRSEDADIPTLENPNTESGGDNWGGSINMQDMYSYLRSVSDTAKAYSFPTKIITKNYLNGSSSTETTNTDNASYSTGFSEYYRYEGKKVIENDQEYASFSFARSSDDNFESYNNSDDSFICLYGGKSDVRGTTASDYSTSNASTSIKTITEVSAGESFVITDNEGNFLRVTGTGSAGITNVTTPTTGCYFTLNSTGYLYTTYSNRTYYLYQYNSGNTIRANTSSSNNNSYKWNYDSTNNRLSVNNSTRYLYYNGSSWVLVQSTTVSTQSYSFSYNGKYLNVNNENNVEYSSGNNTSWYMNGSYVYTLINNNKYYLCYSGEKVYLAQSGTKLLYGSNKFYYTISEDDYWYSTTYYYPAKVDGNKLLMITDSTATSTGKMGGTAFTRNNLETSYQYTNYNTYLTNQYFTTTNSSTSTPYYDINPTYFPLTREKDEEGNYTGSGKPDEKNTGYVVSGSNLNDSTQGPYGDIRVSRYSMSDISVALHNDTSFSDNKLEVVTRTSVKNNNGDYEDTGWTLISDDYNNGYDYSTVPSSLRNKCSQKLNFKNELFLNKYKSSRSQMGSTLSTGNGNIFGLHFMDAAISKDRLVEASNVTILDGETIVDDVVTGSYYPKYELPQDSIDFNLKDQGFINFFAGTYFTDNNTFFSLHKITRDANHKITNIQEIKKIYAPASGDPSNDNPYLYSFDDNKPQGAGDEIFDTAWITNPDIVDNAVYYFEIPVNAGEYALGSVSGKNGAYLMYLDIGAGIGNYKDIITTEKINSTIRDSSYPFGIDFQTFTIGSERDEVVGGNTASIKLLNGNAGQTLNYNYKSPSTSLDVTASNITDPSININYCNVGVTVNKILSDQTSSALTFSPPVLYEMMDNKVTYESYNVFTSTVTRTVSQEYTITGGETGLQIQLPKPLVSDGFTITTPISYSATGAATITSTDGLLTFNSSGTVNVTMTYVETMTNVEQWETASHITSDDTEGTIIGYHFRDYVDPNTVIRFVYDGQNYTYTMYITSSEDTTLYIDSLPLEGYTVVIIVNNDETHKTTLISTSETESIEIVGA